MLDFNKFVPRSNCGYILNVFGEVIDCNRGLMLSEVIDGCKYAKMDWYDGVRYYEVGLVCVIASLGMNVPVEHWDKITVGYMDNDRTNTAPANIYYTFSTPIEAKGFPGFHYVPGFTRYAISLEGELVNVERCNKKSWYVVKPDTKKGIRGGYRVTQAYTDRNERTNLSRHRAMALTYIPCSGVPGEMLVNHLDGIGGNDTTTNLEWTTHQGNVQHAYDNGLYASKTRAVLVKNATTEEITRYRSLTECCVKHGLNHATLSNRLRNNPGKFYTDGFAYKEDNDTPWIEEVVKERITKEIIFRNVFTNETILVNNQREASDITGIDTKKIWYRASQASEIPLNGFLFRYHDEDGIEWPRFTKEQLEQFKQSND